jgi:transposase
MGFDGGYQTVKRYVRKLRGNQPLQPHAVILTGPGEESQVDFGAGAMVRGSQTRKYRRTRLFVMVLGFSRKAARFLTFCSSSRIWAELPEKALRRLGGVRGSSSWIICARAYSSLTSTIHFESSLL